MITLFDHQREAAAACLFAKRFGLFFEPGTGKTISLLEVARLRPLKTLVVCPKSIMESAWEGDARAMGLPCSILWGPAPRRKALVASNWDLGVCTYEGLKQHAREWVGLGVRRLVIDESSKLKTFDSQVSRCAHWLADQMEEVYLLSGTPAPNSPVEYWSQLRCLGRKYSGSSYYGFEARYTVPVRKTIFVGGKPREVTTGHNQTPEQRAALEALLRTCSRTLRKQDCLSLPKQTDQTIWVEMDAAQKRIYEAAAESLPFRLDDDPDTILKFSTSAALIKCRQITGGYVHAAESVHHVGSAKLDALADLLDSLGPRPVVIWAEFTAEVNAIKALCQARGESVAVIDGHTSHAAGETAAAFQAGKILRLVCHPQAAGHGITLTRASYAIFYSFGFSSENNRQARARIDRIGQTSPCTTYILAIPRTVDVAALKILARKVQSADALRDALAEPRKDATVSTPPEKRDAPCTPPPARATTSPLLRPAFSSPPMSLRFDVSALE